MKNAMIRHTALAASAVLGLFVLGACMNGVPAEEEKVEGTRLSDMHQPQPANTAATSKLDNTQWERSNPSMPLSTSKPITIQTLRFEPNNRLSGDAGCNTYMGDYTLDGETFSVGTLATTKMGCLDNQVATDEAEYLRQLAKVTRLTWRGDDLVLSGEGVELTYRTAPNSDKP